MGALALAFVLRRAAGALASAKGHQADAASRVDRALQLQEEAILLARESVAAQRETNRLLAELLLASADARATKPREPAS